MRKHLAPLAAVLTSITLVPSASADYKADIGYTALQAELGVAMPTGAGVGVSQAEAFEFNISGQYSPNAGNAQFSGKTITLKSGPASVSSHATTVGQHLYGNTTSIAPGIAAIDSWSADDWLNAGFLRALSTSEPAVENRQVQNHSWIGNSSASDAQDVLRRFDYTINRDSYTAVVGVNNWNGAGSPPAHPNLLSNSYNAIAVGLTSGLHSQGLTTVDTAGRIKPDIVAPSTATSYATPMVGAAAALLRDSAGSAASPTNARQPETVKALLMAGATKTESAFGGNWDRTVTRPLDQVYGAGELNIQRSHHILTAGEHAASDNSTVPTRGWDFAQTGEDPSLYFFDVAPNTEMTELSVLLTWNRNITDGNVNPLQWSNPAATLANLDLTLYEASGFTLGSVLDESLSTVDNVEHIYLGDGLAAGRYAFEIASDMADYDYTLAWYSQIVAIPEPAGLVGLIGLTCLLRRRRD